MKESELKGWVAAHLNRDMVPERVWEILKSQGHVTDALRPGADRGRLLRYARSLLIYDETVKQVESLPEQEGDKPPTQPPSFVDHEKERAETRAEYIKFRGTALPGVLEFRMDLYGEARPLVPENAYRLVEEQELREVVTRRFQLPDTDYIEPSGCLEFFGRTQGDIQYIEFYKGSYFERLHDLSQELIKKLFPLWSEAEACWFVLTGEVEAPKALLGDTYSFVGEHLTQGNIRLTVEPWVTAESVVKAYQYLQSQTLGRKPRPLASRNLAVVRFVLRELKEMVIANAQGQPEQIDYPREKLLTQVKEPRPAATLKEGWAEPERRTWRILMERWNRENPDSTYDDERQFYRDFHRVAHTVVRPYSADAPPARISIP